jgi:hypothetical protein
MPYRDGQVATEELDIKTWSYLKVWKTT